MEKFNLFETLQAYPQIKRIIIGYSGGLDSTVLLFACQNDARIRQHYQLLAVHINHGLSPHALAWQQHCQQFCHLHSISFAYHQLQIMRNNDTSLEEQAREQRYQCFAEYMTSDTILLTAHHADDQAETVLLRLLRGSGVAGLAAMPVMRPFAQGLLLRPLLKYTREQLHQFALVQQLSWIDDESNQNIDFDRNYVRQQIIPQLEQRWPAVQTHLNKVAAHCYEAEQLLQSLAKEDMTFICDSQYIVNLTQLEQLSLPRQKNVLRYWLKQAAQIILSEKWLQEIFDSIINASEDAMPSLTIAAVQIRRYRQQLFLCRQEQQPLAPWQIFWDLTQDLILPHGLGVLCVQDYQGYQAQAPLIISSRQPGMTVLLPKRQGHHKVKHLLQEWGIPPWQRGQVVFILADELLIGVQKPSK